MKKKVNMYNKMYLCLHTNKPVLISIKNVMICYDYFNG